MNDATDRLIERLAGDAGPVRRLRPPLVRAGLWLVGAAVAAVVAIANWGDLAHVAARVSDAGTVVELVAILTTGVLAVVAAFNLSLPDGSRAWALAPLPTLALWIASSGYGCYTFVVQSGTSGWEWGAAVGCLRFIVGASVPLGLSLFLLLRRAHPIAPLPVAAMGGLAAAALAAGLLEFFHPFDITIIDLAAHFVAVAVVVGVASLFGRRPRPVPV